MNHKEQTTNFEGFVKEQHGALHYGLNVSTSKHTTSTDLDDLVLVVQRCP